MCIKLRCRCVKAGAECLLHHGIETRTDTVQNGENGQLGRTHTNNILAASAHPFSPSSLLSFYFFLKSPPTHSLSTLRTKHLCFAFSPFTALHRSCSHPSVHHTCSAVSQSVGPHSPSTSDTWQPLRLPRLCCSASNSRTTSCPPT